MPEPLKNQLGEAWRAGALRAGPTLGKPLARVCGGFRCAREQDDPGRDRAATSRRQR